MVVWLVIKHNFSHLILRVTIINILTAAFYSDLLSLTTNHLNPLSIVILLRHHGLASNWAWLWSQACLVLGVNEVKSLKWWESRLKRASSGLKYLHGWSWMVRHFCVPHVKCLIHAVMRAEMWDSEIVGKTPKYSSDCYFKFKSTIFELSVRLMMMS